MQLPDPVTYAIPFFVLMVILEIIIWKATGRAVYETRDTFASLAMGLGNVAAGVLYAAAFTGIYAFVYEHRVFDIGYEWWAFPLAYVVKDFLYYWYHRWSHEVRWFWADHVVHHSSQHYNLSTALRQPWTSTFTGLFVIAIPALWLGIPPLLFAFVSGLNLIYQFWIHTEVIGKLPKPVEAVFNTPSHHRVHHATNPRYLDANYAGTLIIWDRMFGTFVPEDATEKPRYGIVKNLHTFNPLMVAVHEFLGIFRDWKSARSFGEWWGYTFGPPGWSPDGSRKTSAILKEDWKRARAGAEGQGAAAPATAADARRETPPVAAAE